MTKSKSWKFNFFVGIDISNFKGQFQAIKVSGNHTSGANDTFLAVYMLACFLQFDFQDAARLASKATGIVIDKKDTAICSANELELALSAEDKLVKSKIQLGWRC